MELYDNDAMTRQLATSLGSRIKQIRERRGLSQIELGSCPGLSYGTIRDIEDGNPRGRELKTLVALALALDVSSLDELFGPPMTPTSALFEKHRAEVKRSGAATQINST